MNKKYFLKKYNALIIALLTIFGISSCSHQAMYGSPSADFIINGKVSSLDSNIAISNIKVKLNYKETFTDNNGYYEIRIKGMRPENQNLSINFIDIDSTLNGFYNDLDTNVVFTNPQFVNGDGNWYEGETTKEFNVKLTKK